jgi:hypothetical protein
LSLGCVSPVAATRIEAGRTKQKSKNSRKGIQNFGTHLPAGFFLTQKNKIPVMLSLSPPYHAAS